VCGAVIALGLASLKGGKGNQSMGTTLQIDNWIDRTRALEKVLEIHGRADLAPVVLAVREALVDAKHERIGREATLTVVASAVKELRACVVEPARKPSPEVIASLEQLLGSKGNHEHASLQTGSSHKPTTPAPSDMGAVETLLSSLGNMENDSLDGLVAGLRMSKDIKDELGTMRGPLLDGAKDARVLMKGELHPGLLTDLIQLFAQNSETGRLVLQEAESMRLASIYFQTGQIVDATIDGLVGEDAFLRSMAIRDGLFSYQRDVVSETTRITRSTRHLIFEALKVFDETPSAPGVAPSPRGEE